MPRRGVELSQLEIIPDGAVLIRDGVLQEVGPSRRVENLAAARDAVEINAAGHIVLPGFIDSHMHLAFPPPSAPETDRLAASRAIADQTASSLAIRTRIMIDAMARHGTTTVEVKTGCGLDEHAETKILKVLASMQKDPLDILGSLLLSFPGGEGDEALDSAAQWLTNEFLPKIRKRRLARFADIAWSGGAERQPRFHRVMERARKLGFACRVHADEEEPAAAIRLAVGQLALSVDHLEHAVPLDASLLSGSPTMVTLLPSTSFMQGRGNPPARSLVESGVPVVLASNYNPHFNPTLNMQSVIAMACLRMGLTAAEAVSAATINAAHALGIANQVGSIEAGKAADLVVLNARDYRDLEHSLGTNLVHTTIKNGVPIYHEGEVAARQRGMVTRPATLN
jgi:imidazolonepropionase